MQGGVQGDERLHACYSSNHDRVADLLADDSADVEPNFGAVSLAHHFGADCGSDCDAQRVADECANECADATDKSADIADEGSDEQSDEVSFRSGTSSPAAHKCADDGANANGRPHDGV